MSPPFEMPKSQSSGNENLMHSQGFSFSADSIFNHGADDISSRSKPRLTKMRKQTVASQNRKSVKTELNLNGFSGAGAEIKLKAELENVFSTNYGNPGLKVTAKNEDLTRSAARFERFSSGGLASRDNMNDSVFNLGSGNEDSLFGSRMNSSTSKVNMKDGSFSFAPGKGVLNSNTQKANGTFVFGTFKEESKINQKSEGGVPCNNTSDRVSNFESGCFVFGVRESHSAFNPTFTSKESNLGPRRPIIDGFPTSGNFEYVFGSDKNGHHSNVFSNRKDSSKPGQDSSLDEIGKVNSTSFVFHAGKNASTATDLNSRKQHCGIYGDKNGSSEKVGNAVPDMRGKVKLDTHGNSEKVSYPCFKFSSDRSDTVRKTDVNFVFCSANDNTKSHTDLEDNINNRRGTKPDFMYFKKENTKTEPKFQNASLNGVFVFGGLKGKTCFGSGVNPVFVDEINQLHQEKAKDCNGFREHELHNHEFDSDTKDKFRNSCRSGADSERDPIKDLSDEMKRLNVDSSETDCYKTQNFHSNVAASINDAFIFASTQQNACSMNVNHPVTATYKTENVNPLPQRSTELSGTSSLLFSSAGIGIEPNGGYHEFPLNKNEKTEGISFTSKLSGLGLSGADDNIPTMKFSLPTYGMYPDVGRKSDTASWKWLRGKRSTKKKGKLKQKTFVQQLFKQDQPPNSGSSPQNNSSSACGSPMDFSPYQDTSKSSAPPVGIDAIIKEEAFTGNEKDILENCETQCNDEKTSTLYSPLPAPDGLSAIRRQYRKYKLKVGINHAVQSNTSLRENVRQVANGATAAEVCEHWRIRGNQAYHAGKLSKAEEFYSIGISSVSGISTQGNSVKPLVLCYSNRAATRMSLGRMWEAIVDCRKAAELDPSFLKVTLRAGNCYLVLGEVEEAIQCYSKCLESGTGICLDRRATIEAADSLQKAKRVAECMRQSAKLLHEATQDAASTALENIVGALSISRFSEELLEMKGKALCILRKYDEVIQLCEQTLQAAKKNVGVNDLDDLNCKSSHVKLWRWHLKSKAHYHLGKLDVALDMIEQQDRIPLSSTLGDVTQDSSTVLADTIRELLHLKKSGNEAFHSGRYTEAIDHYTVAISRSVESRPFMAVCFCNRAASYQAMCQITDAIADCSVAIALDENYLKAISRRATLNEMIRDYKQALCDLQRLVSLLESQSQAKSDTRRESSASSVRDLRKARRRVSLIEDKAKRDIPLDLYLILGIKASDTESEIKKAYRKAALRHHPDKVLVRSDVGDGGTLWKEVGEKIHMDADRLFKMIGEAYAVLSDSSKRLEYDDREEMMKSYWNGNRNNNSGRPSTSYSSPNGKGSWNGRQSGFSTSSERSYSRRYWYDSRSYSTSQTQW